MTTSMTGLVREVVDRTPTGSFIRSRDLVPSTGSRASVDTALHRLVATEPLVPVRPGLYFKGKRTRFGVTRPDAITVGFEVAKGRGFDSGYGPAGVSAARLLGMTTQVPAVEEIAVPGRAPAEPKGVRYRTRTPIGRHGLSTTEVAVLELLREWPRYCEATWAEFISTVAKLCLRGAVDVDRIRDAAAREHHLAAKERAAKLADAVHALTPR